VVVEQHWPEPEAAEEPRWLAPVGVVVLRWPLAPVAAAGQR
jgi:hypothetical protein